MWRIVENIPATPVTREAPRHWQSKVKHRPPCVIVCCHCGTWQPFPLVKLKHEIFDLGETLSRIPYGNARYLSEHVRILRELRDVTVTTGQDAVFEVELSHLGVTAGEWWLGDNLLQNNDLNQMSSEGRVHRLALKMVTTDESGDVAFVVGEEKSVACLLVEEKPKGEGNKDLPSV